MTLEEVIACLVIALWGMTVWVLYLRQQIRERNETIDEQSQVIDTYVNMLCDPSAPPRPEPSRPFRLR